MSYTLDQLKDLMESHPSVRPNVLGLVHRVIDQFYSEIVQQLGTATPQNAPVNLLLASIDDSGSMKFKESEDASVLMNAELVEKGYNTLIAALQRSSAQYRTMVGAMLLNNGRVYAFERLLDVPTLKLVPTQWATPLYKSAMISMVVLLVKSAILLEESGIRSSTTLLLLSDGVNYGDDTFSAAEVKLLAESMLASKRVKHQFIGIGVSHPDAPDYDGLFASMGVPQGCSHTAVKDEHAFRQLFDEVTTSIEQHAGSGGMAAGEMVGGPSRGAPVVVEEETEELGTLPGYAGARDGTTSTMQPGIEPWAQENFGGSAPTTY